MNHEKMISMTNEALVAKIAKLRPIMEKFHDISEDLEQKIFTNRANVIRKDISFTEGKNADFIIRGDADHIEIRVYKEERTEKEYRDFRDIDIYIGNVYDHNTFKYTNKKEVRMNFCSFGSFCPSNHYAMTYVKMLNEVGSTLGHLEEMVNGEEEFVAKLNKARHLCYGFGKEIEFMENELKKREMDAKKKVIRESLCAGMVIDCAPKSKKYSWSITTVKVLKVNSKTVNMDNFTRVKIEDLVQNIATGKYEIVKMCA